MKRVRSLSPFLISPRPRLAFPFIRQNRWFRFCSARFLLLLQVSISKAWSNFSAAHIELAFGSLQDFPWQKKFFLHLKTPWRRLFGSAARSKTVLPQLLSSTEWRFRSSSIEFIPFPCEQTSSLSCTERNRATEKMTMVLLHWLGWKSKLPVLVWAV